MTARPKLRIGVVGAGVMGRGIVQLFAQAGHPVKVFDAFEGAVPKAVASVAAMIEKGVEKKQRTREQADTIVAAITPCTAIEQLADCDLVIEAIIEEIDAKQALFAQLEAILAKGAILASNTSSLVVAEIAAKCAHPGRVAGLHFFNPVPLMKVVEVIAAVRTAPSVVDTLRAAVEGTGHRAVITADQPGFLVNHAGRGYYTEALRLLEEQVADIADIDALLRDAAGFKMGPFELMDLTGLDVSGKVMESIYAQFHQEPRFRPSSLVPPRIAAGLYGRKSGAGWYAYGDDAKPVQPSEAKTRAVPPGLKVWIAPDAAQRAGIAALAQEAGAIVIDDHENAELLIIQPWGFDASTVCGQLGLDATRTVAVDPLPGLATRITLMLTPVTTVDSRELATTILGIDGAKLTVISDSPGFVVQRVLATVVNIAANIAQRGIATVADIEDAVRLGLGYPKGPLGWGDALGGAHVLEILRNMQLVAGDPRYRPSLWLQRRVALGVSLLTAESPRT